MKTLAISQAPAIHYTAPYLLNPTHPVSVLLIGCGGTGSQVLSALGRLNEALLALGHPGIHVTAYDGEAVTEANVGRQLFSRSDIGLNKAEVLTSRVNRFFGLRWQAIPSQYGETGKEAETANILITCVDTAHARMGIGSLYRAARSYGYSPYKFPYYWLDMGNMRDTGQVVLGTLTPITQPRGTPGTVARLPTFPDLFPDALKEDQNEEPSCSLAEALTRQDLFINQTVATYGMSLLWDLFRDMAITHHGAYINLKTFRTSPILIQPERRKRKKTAVESVIAA